MHLEKDNLTYKFISSDAGFSTLKARMDLARNPAEATPEQVFKNAQFSRCIRQGQEFTLGAKSEEGQMAPWGEGVCLSYKEGKERTEK